VGKLWPQWWQEGPGHIQEEVLAGEPGLLSGPALSLEERGTGETEAAGEVAGEEEGLEEWSGTRAGEGVVG
jgi:hypothetical protein